MVETTLIDVNCEIKMTKKNDKYLEFKCPFCKKYNKNGTEKKKNSDVYHNHGFTKDNPTRRSPHCQIANLKDKVVDYEFLLHY